MLALPDKNLKETILNMYEDLKENMVIMKEKNIRIEIETTKKRTKWEFLTEKYNV